MTTYLIGWTVGEPLNPPTEVWVDKHLVQATTPQKACEHYVNYCSDVVVHNPTASLQCKEYLLM